MDDQLFRDLAQLAPAVDETAARAQLARQRVTRTNRQRAVQAVALLAVVTVAVVAVVQLRRDDSTSVQTSDGTAPDSSSASCEQVDALAGVLANLGITYDFDPSESSTHLRAMSDATVAGVLQQLTTRGDELIFTVRIGQVISGDLAPGDDIEVAVQYNPGEVEPADVEAAFTPGTGGVFFLADPAAAVDASTWTPHVEGFWLTCEGQPPRSALYEPSWTVETPEQLVEDG